MQLFKDLSYSGWLHAAECHLRQLQVIQNSALRLITGHNRFTRIYQLHEDADIPFLLQYLHRLHQQFWTKLRRSPYQEVSQIATEVPIRQRHKMPRLA